MNWNRVPTGRALLAAALLGLWLVGGCSRDSAQEAADSDANGYSCRACSEKFHTARQVFAEKCPKCSSLNLGELTGYLCPKDGHLTVAPRDVGAAVCQKCGQLAREIKLPRAKDFQAAGIPRKEHAQVVVSK